MKIYEIPFQHTHTRQAKLNRYTFVHNKLPLCEMFGIHKRQKKTT